MRYVEYCRILRYCTYTEEGQDSYVRTDVSESCHHNEPQGRMMGAIDQQLPTLRNLTIACRHGIAISLPVVKVSALYNHIPLMNTSASLVSPNRKKQC
jgi:hypothetical protein